MSRFSRFSALALALSLSLGAGGSVFAQTTPPAPGVPAGVPPAPKGHHQPTASDVPGDDSAQGASPSSGTPGGLSAGQKADDEKARKIMGGVCSTC